MATRKDLLKAQSFTSRRMISAFVNRDPDDPTPPLRRVATATFVSVLIGVILCAGAALLGLVGKFGGNSNWKQDGVIISDTTAGVQFVYVEDQLIPMANVASARLMAGYYNNGEEPSVINVKTDKLKGAEQGAPRGIPNAPRQLPDPDSMNVYPLRLCSSAPNSAQDRFLSLEFEATSPPGDYQTSFVARASNDDEYLIMNGQAHRLWREQGKASPLIEELPVVSPGTAWLSAIPVGAPIVPLEIPNVGARPAKDPLGMTVGQLAVVERSESEGGYNRYFIQLEQGLSQISYLDMRLQIAANGATEPRRISESDLATARNEEQPTLSDEAMPFEKPVGPAGYGSLENVSVCATYNPDDPQRVTVAVDQPTPEIPRNQLKPYGNRLDVIKTPTLSGGLFRNAANSSSSTTTFLVTEGKSYPIPDTPSRKALGYGEVTPAPVPGQLLALFEPGLGPDMNLSFEHIQELPSTDG